MGSCPHRLAACPGFLLALLICFLAPATLAAADIPLDSKGLPLWEVRQYVDFPVRLELDRHEDLDALLAAVPIASFNREQVEIVFASPKEFHLVFEPRVTEAEATALTAAGYSFARIPDLEQQVRREMESAWAAQAATGGHLLTFGQRDVYHTHAQIGALLAQAETDHPTIASDLVYGYSVQGRELWGVVISDNVATEEAEPEVRLSSTMHGDEPPGTELLLYLVDYLTDNYGLPGYEDVTYLVDNYEIHILPMHNPDGYVAGTRRNANNVDLNRNFPVPDGTIGDDGTWTEEIEVVVFKNYGFSHHFVISANGHTGALVVNYPWDYTYTLAPDNDAIIQMSLEYSTYNLPMYNGSFPQGITNGAQWYVVHGSLQDWSYHETGCIDVTLELNNVKWPPASQLPGLWDDNRESFMHWIKSARFGVNGIVTGSDTGLPLDATITVVGNDEPVATDPDLGDYYKLLDTGTFDITFSADGYITHTEYGVATTWGTPNVLNVVLDPVAHGDIVGNVRDEGGTGLDADVEVRTYPGDLYVTTVQSDAGNDGYYTVNLVHGEYRLIASSPGHASAEALATVGASPVTVDFTLVTTEEVVLFSDDFEGGTGQWTGGWGLADPPEGHASSNSMTDSPGAGEDYDRYEDNECVMAAALDLSTAYSGMLTFWAKWDIEANWDCCKFQISLDGGAWTSLATTHTEPASGQGAQVPAGDPVFEGSQANWVENRIDLTPWLGETDVRFRFHLGSDSSVQRDGFYFDDFQVVITSEVTAGVDSPPPGLTGWLAAFPNPFNPQTTLRFATGQVGAVRVAVYDVRGRLVRDLVDEVLGAGEHVVRWDGRTDGGIAVPSGVYFCRLVAGDVRQSIKLMLLK